MKTVVPESVTVTCDGCSRICVGDTGVTGPTHSRRANNAVLVIRATPSIGVGDGRTAIDVERELCDECFAVVTDMVNQAISGRRA